MIPGCHRRSTMMQMLQTYIDQMEEMDLVRKTMVPEETRNKPITHLSYDSKDMTTGGIFVCKGAHFLPSYLEEAISNGAICYVSEKEYKEAGDLFPRVIVSDIKKAMAILGNIFYEEAWKKLTLIGVTGTKGKSTTTYYIKYILDHHQKEQGKEPCAILSGIDVEDGVIFEESHLTTPEAIMLHRHFKNAVDSGRKYLVMEVSSQALKYDRTLGVTFTSSCFLNIGEDHISPIEHSDFEDYVESKLRLFCQSETSCINIDAQYSERVLEAAEGKTKILKFGAGEGADIRVSGIRSDSDGIDFTVTTPLFTAPFRLSMTGLFNVENALAAIAVCHSLWIPYSAMYEGLKKARVPGRMETFLGVKSKILLIVDYAHNRMSFERLFDSTKKEYPGRSIIAVFGCPGKKALARRRELAEVAGAHSKKIFITEEDAGEEPVLDISVEIAKYVKETGCPYEIVLDREEAIRRAIDEADENTVILLTGKGRETRQKRGTEYIDCPSDVDYVMKYLV